MLQNSTSFIIKFMINKIHVIESHPKLMTKFSKLFLHLDIATDILFEKINYKTDVYKVFITQSK